jgi:hypothetical protein
VRTFLRRLRGAISLALLWAAVWLPAGALLTLLSGWTGHSLRLPLWYFGIWTALGALSGGVFALLLAVLERRQSFQQLSARRLAIWGAIAGGAIPIGGSLLIVALFSDLSLSADAPSAFASMALLGAACAVATLSLARRGAPVETGAPPT